VVGDIGQPQYHKCIKKQKNIVKEKQKNIVKEKQENVTNHNVTQMLLEKCVAGI